MTTVAVSILAFLLGFALASHLYRTALTTAYKSSTRHLRKSTLQLQQSTRHLQQWIAQAATWKHHWNVANRDRTRLIRAVTEAHNAGNALDSDAEKWAFMLAEVRTIAREIAEREAAGEVWPSESTPNESTR